MNMFSRLLISLGGLLLSMSALAGSSIDNARIELVGVGPTYDAFCGYPCMVIAFVTTPPGSPCSMNAGWHYAIDLRTPEGRTVAAVALSAKATGNLVQAAGKGTCVFSASRVEELSYVFMK
jgi:hypothetical protein